MRRILGMALIAAAPLLGLLHLLMGLPNAADALARMLWADYASLASGSAAADLLIYGMLVLMAVFGLALFMPGDDAA